MAILLAALSSVFIGSSEHIASDASRRIRPEEMAVGFFVIGVLVAPLLVLMVPSELHADDIGLGALAGLGNGLGILFIYRAYSVSTVGVALPLAAVLTAVIPVLIDMVGSDGPVGALTTLGIVIGVVAVALTSISPDLGGQLLKGIAWAAASGLGFGVTLSAIGSTDEASGMWPVLPQRMIALLVVVIVARATGPRLMPPKGQRRPAYVAGVLGSAALATFVAAAQRGALGPVSVAGSQYPAVAVFLGFALRGERIWWWQTVGLGAAVVSVSLIALG